MSVAVSNPLSLLFITGCCIFFLWAPPSSTVSPQARHFVFLAVSVAHTADPKLFSGVNVVYYFTLFGAWVADQKATFSAMVSAFGRGEPVKAAHAPEGCLIRDPSHSKGGTQLAAAFPQQAWLAVFNVIHPGPLLLIWGSSHKERLAWGTDQPSVPQFIIIIHILKLDVLWNYIEDGILILLQKKHKKCRQDYPLRQLKFWGFYKGFIMNNSFTIFCTRLKV